MGHRETKPHLAGSVYWTERVRSVGVPVPRILFYDLEGAFPYTVIEHIPGVDLGDIYQKLRKDTRKEVAEQIANIQLKVQSLPPASGYGFAFSYEDRRLQQSWHEVIHQQLNRARNWIQSAGICDVTHVDRVEVCLSRLSDYFDGVNPIPFLHDTTTKNVLVSDTGLRGIVDVDDLCFGDPLLVLALTRMALLANDWETDYVHHWASAWQLSGYQSEALDFYTALFCVTFMGEIGQKFNKDSAIIDSGKVVRYENILDSLIG
jgi:aminoglycoside phosphotransferase (APT) family kinase protein